MSSLPCLLLQKPHRRFIILGLLVSALVRCGSSNDAGTATGGAGSGGTTSTAGQSGGGRAGSGGSRTGTAGHSGNGEAGLDSEAGAGGDLGSGGTSGTAGAASGGAAGHGGAGGGGKGGVSGGNGGSGGKGGASAGGTGGASSGGGGTSSGGGAGQGGTGGTGGAPRTDAQLCFVNATPGTAMDVCIKSSSAATYTAPPVFEALGLAAGIAPGEISKAFSYPLDAKLYDFLFVNGAGADCSLGIGADGKLPIARDSIFAIIQYSFGLPAYNGILLDASHADLKQGSANVRFFFADQGAKFADFYGKPAAGAETQWFSNVATYTGSNYHSVGAGTYGFRVAPAGTATTWANVPSVALAADQRLDTFLYPTSATTYGLMMCPGAGSALTNACVQ